MEEYGSLLNTVGVGDFTEDNTVYGNVSKRSKTSVKNKKKNSSVGGRSLNSKETNGIDRIP